MKKEKKIISKRNEKRKKIKDGGETIRERRERKYHTDNDITIFRYIKNQAIEEAEFDFILYVYYRYLFHLNDFQFHE